MPINFSSFQAVTIRLEFSTTPSMHFRFSIGLRSPSVESFKIMEGSVQFSFGYLADFSKGQQPWKLNGDVPLLFLNNPNLNSLNEKVLTLNNFVICSV